MKLSVCTDSVFSGIDTVTAMREVKKLGIDNIEFWSWWDKDIEEINSVRQELGMTIVGICTKFISLTEPDARGDYLQGLGETIATANQLECQMIISQVGSATHASDEIQHQSIVSGLLAAKSQLERSKKVLVIEPLNTKVDHPDSFLSSSSLAAEILTTVGSANIQLLYDFYHQQMMKEDVIRQSRKLIKQIGHVHIAGNPKRNEPELGELNYEKVIKTLAAANYSGWVGLEYMPTKKVAETLNRWQQFVQAQS